MSSEVYNMQTISTRKSKKIKLSDEKSINQSHNYPPKIEDLEWINHEIIIDDEMIEDSSMNNTLNSGNTNKIKREMIQLALPPFKSENDYSFSNSKGTETSSIALRQDLFPIKSKEKDVIEATIADAASESKPVKTSSLKLSLPQIDLSQAVTNSKEKRSSSQFPVVLKKVNPKEVPIKIKEARNLLKSNMNLTATCKINQVVLKHTHSPLKRVESGINKALNITENNKNLVIVKQGLTEYFAETTSRHKRHSPNIVKKKGIVQKSNYEPIITNSQEEVIDSIKKSDLERTKPDEKILKNHLITQKSELIEKSILLKKVETNQVPEQIKKSILIQKINTISNQHQNACKVDISENIMEVLESDTSEVRLSSLANASEISAVDSTSKPLKFLGQDVIKPSTSNNIKVIDNNVNGIVNMESTSADYTEELSDDDDSDEEELGLNSLEELQQYWEFLVDLHDYNKQVIKSLQNRKRRYLLRINKLEHHLKHNLGIQFDESEDEEDDSSESSTKEVEQRTEEESLVVEKENRPMEE